MSATLRAMTMSDIDSITELEHRLFPIDYWSRDMFVSEVSQPDTRHYVIAEVDGAVVGYAGLMCIEPSADIQTIAVLPEYEGRGIGTSMLKALLTEARNRGGQEALLEVRADNPRAQNLYLRFGFSQIHVRKKYYRDGVDALIMKRDLATWGSEETL